MTKKEFFEKIVQNATDEAEKIILIIKARGFLLDKKDDDFYVSDNATYNDCIYLKECLEKYNLGTIVGEKLREYHGRYREHKILIPYTAKIELSEMANIPNAILLFEDVRRVGYEICNQTRKWSEFIYRSFGTKVSVRVLEPYVSYYVKAVSSCGVNTCFSCDGNHPNGGQLVVHSDYPYCCWHRFIIDFIVPKHMAHDIECGIIYNAETQYEVYYEVYLMADYLYKNRETIRNIKKTACKTLNRKIQKQLSKEMIETVFVENCKQYMEGRNK